MRDYLKNPEAIVTMLAKTVKWDKYTLFTVLFNQRLTYERILFEWRQTKHRELYKGMHKLSRIKIDTNLLLGNFIFDNIIPCVIPFSHIQPGSNYTTIFINSIIYKYS